MGDSAPPSTWYTPENTAVRSMAAMSRGSQTTHTIEASRRDEAQISHKSPSA